MKRYIGIDIGGTKCSVILGHTDEINSNDKSINIMEKISFPTEVKKGPNYSIGKITDAITSVMKLHNLTSSDIESLGISCGGPLDSKNGIIKSPPNLYGWDNIEIVKHIENKFKIKSSLQNDANACALAEWRFGAARGYKNAIFLTCGTGFGAGLILDGKLYSGSTDMAGEIGHVRAERNGPVGYGKAGSFEGFCSGGGIAQIAKTMVLEKLQMGEDVSFCKSIDNMDQIDTKIVAKAAAEGDALAMKIYRESGKYLGKALSFFIDVLNPEIIVIGSIFARNHDLLWPSAKEEIYSETLSYTRNACKVVPAALGENLGDIAALAVAAYKEV